MINCKFSLSILIVLVSAWPGNHDGIGIEGVEGNLESRDTLGVREPDASHCLNLRCVPFPQDELIIGLTGQCK